MHAGYGNTVYMSLTSLALKKKKVSEEEKSVLEIFNAVTCINNCSSHGKCTEKG